jgi:hypothetical protein
MKRPRGSKCGGITWHIAMQKSTTSSEKKYFGTAIMVKNGGKHRKKYISPYLSVPTLKYFPLKA